MFAAATGSLKQNRQWSSVDSCNEDAGSLNSLLSANFDAPMDKDDIKQYLVNHEFVRYSATDGQANSVPYDYGTQQHDSETHIHDDDHGPPSPLQGFAHCHQYNENEQEARIDRNAKMRLIVASVLCVVFMIAEAVGGFIADSLAIMTDAAHLLTDFASFMISLFAMHMATRPASKKFSFGWHRAEIVGALISVLLIYMGIQRIVYSDYDIKAKWMLCTSGIGVTINIIIGGVLYQHGHTHGGGGNSHGHSHLMAMATTTNTSGAHQHNSSHGHSHDATLAEAGQTADSLATVGQLNVRAAFLHALGDLIQSLGVFVAAIVIYFRPEWKIADPICTFIFSALVVITTVAIIRDIINVLMEGTPTSISFRAVHADLLAIDGVQHVHDLRIWSLSLTKISMSVHMAIDCTRSPDEVLSQVQDAMMAKYKITECTIQIEPYSEYMTKCKKCEQLPDK